MSSGGIPASGPLRPGGSAFEILLKRREVEYTHFFCFRIHITQKYVSIKKVM
jgi:hypothetical protein